MSDERLLNIETTVAYQEDLLNALNKTVAEQALKIDLLEKIIKQLTQQQEQVAELLSSQNIIDERPPHY